MKNEWICELPPPLKIKIFKLRSNGLYICGPTHFNHSSLSSTLSIPAFFKSSSITVHENKGRSHQSNNMKFNSTPLNFIDCLIWLTSRMAEEKWVDWWRQLLLRNQSMNASRSTPQFSLRIACCPTAFSSLELLRPASFRSFSFMLQLHSLHYALPARSIAAPSRAPLNLFLFFSSIQLHNSLSFRSLPLAEPLAGQPAHNPPKKGNEESCFVDFAGCRSQ